MAFERENVAYHEPSRGSGGLMVYQHPTDNLAAIRAAGYWTTAGLVASGDYHGVQMFVQRQRLSRAPDGSAITGADLARQRVPMLIISGASAGGGQQLISMGLSAANALVPQA